MLVLNKYVQIGNSLFMCLYLLLLLTTRDIVNEIYGVLAVIAALKVTMYSVGKGLIRLVCVSVMSVYVLLG